MIDLHTHTRHSDGADEVSELLKKAQELGLKCISITDHNTCRAYKELENPEIRKLYSGKIIPGVELNTKVLGIPIEILGYNVDTDKLQELINQIYISNEDRCKLEVERLYKKCLSENISLPENFVEKYDGTMYASKYLHSYITLNDKNRNYISEASWNDSNIFYREYMSEPTSMFYLNMDDILPDFETASSIIRKAGGLVFIPHIFEYRENSEKILNYILANYNFDGIECFYRNFTKEQSNYLKNICKNHGLYVSGGSDYHGMKHPKVHLGIGEGSLNVPDEIIENWKEIRFI